MSKFSFWVLKHRLKIGYTIGILNIFCGLFNIAVGSVIPGLFWSAVGAFIIFDVRSYR